MLEFVLTMIGFAAAMSIPVFLTAIVESATSTIRASPLQATSPGGRT